VTTGTGQEGLRARRVAASIRERLSTELSRGLSDPALSSVVITEVELSDDLGIAHVKVRLLVGGEDAARRAVVLRHLARVGGRLRKSLSGTLRLKRLPELKFQYDEGIDAAARVQELLTEIAADRKSSE